MLQTVSRSSRQALIDEIDDVITFVRQSVDKRRHILDDVEPGYVPSAVNLIHYQALRSRDLSRLQRRLKNLGMSRLARAEGHVLASLTASRNLLAALEGSKPSKLDKAVVSIKKGRRQGRRNRHMLLGRGDKSKHALIMVTQPTEAAEDYNLVERMLLSGMRIARINCAHDDASVWSRMIQNVRQAATATGVECKIAMDLAGPKIRTGSIEAGPKIIKVRPIRDQRGRLLKPSRVWIGDLDADIPDDIVAIPAECDDYSRIGANLFLADARGRTRRVRIEETKGNGVIGQIRKTAYLETGMPLYFDKAKTDIAGVVGELHPLDGYIYLRRGDEIKLTDARITARCRLEDDESSAIPEIHCTHEGVISQVDVGDPVLFDDGCFVGHVIDTQSDGIIVRLDAVRKNGSKLRAEKGINFPESDLHVAGLTKKDREDLPFVLKNADIVNMSFVNDPNDVDELLDAIDQAGVNNKIGVVLKIETKRAFTNLVEIILTGMKTHPLGIMIARGDLALEVGWVRLAVVQREIMMLCNAAHIPDIWATQVFESLAKNGIPSRPEMTDLWIAQRSDCVMLNKGPFMIEAIDLLDTVLTKMEPWHDRDRAMLPPLEEAVV